MADSRTMTMISLVREAWGGGGVSVVLLVSVLASSIFSWRGERQVQLSVSQWCPRSSQSLLPCTIIRLVRTDTSRPSHLEVQTVTLTAQLWPLVLPAGLAALPPLPRTGALTGGVLQDGDSGALLVTEPRPHPAPAQHHGDHPGPGQTRHTPREAGTAGAASRAPVDLEVTSDERRLVEVLDWYWPGHGWGSCGGPRCCWATARSPPRAGAGRGCSRTARRTPGSCCRTSSCWRRRRRRDWGGKEKPSRGLVPSDWTGRGWQWCWDHSGDHRPHPDRSEDQLTSWVRAGPVLQYHTPHSGGEGGAITITITRSIVPLWQPHTSLLALLCQRRQSKYLNLKTRPAVRCGDNDNHQLFPDLEIFYTACSQGRLTVGEERGGEETSDKAVTAGVTILSWSETTTGRAERERKTPGHPALWSLSSHLPRLSVLRGITTPALQSLIW